MKKILVLLEFNHRQLGKTDKWLLDKMESAFAKGEDAEADFLNKWNIGTAESAIDKKYLDISSAFMYNKENPQFYTSQELG